MIWIAIRVYTQADTLYNLKNFFVNFVFINAKKNVDYDNINNSVG